MAKDQVIGSNVDIKALLAAGAHFGHKTSRWHPKMAPFIHSKRGDIHIINLERTVEQLESALQFVEDVTSKGQQVLFVGTKRQAKDIIKQSAIDAGQPYVTERWLGGMLTNSNTINVRVKRLKELETKMVSGELAAKYNKLEVQRYQEQIDAMNISFGGIKDLQGRPGVVFISDIATDHTALKEANRLSIPVIALVDTNVDPTKVNYPLAANDDAIKTIALICDYIKAAIEAGKAKRSAKVEQVVSDKEEVISKNPK